jgi:hypothetical protein
VLFEPRSSEFRHIERAVSGKERGLSGSVCSGECDELGVERPSDEVDVAGEVEVQVSRNDPTRVLTSHLTR